MYISVEKSFLYFLKGNFIYNLIKSDINQKFSLKKRNNVAADEFYVYNFIILIFFFIFAFKKIAVRIKNVLKTFM